MARTIRRKHYVPSWVTEAWEFEFTDHKGRRCFYGYRQLEGEERARKLRWWHEDKSCFWGVRPPKPYRKKHEERHRAEARAQLTRWRKDPEFPVQLGRKPKLGYWD